MQAPDLSGPSRGVSTSHNVAGGAGVACRASKRASQEIEELAEEVLAAYLRRPSMGKAVGKAGGSGNAVVALYLEAQDLLVKDRPQAALWAARRGLRLARDLVSGLAAPTFSRPAGRPMTDGYAWLLSREAHDLLERLVDGGVRPGVGRAGSLELRMPGGGPFGGEAALPAALEGTVADLQEELERLLVWDGEEARSLLSEAYRFVADRWRPGVREPECAPRLWTAALEAVARQDMGRMRVLLRKWVRAYSREIRRFEAGRRVGWGSRVDGAYDGHPAPDTPGSAPADRFRAGGAVRRGVR